MLAVRSYGRPARTAANLSVGPSCSDIFFPVAGPFTTYVDDQVLDQCANMKVELLATGPDSVKEIAGGYLQFNVAVGVAAGFVIHTPGIAGAFSVKHDFIINPGTGAFFTPGFTQNPAPATSADYDFFVECSESLGTVTCQFYFPMNGYAQPVPASGTFPAGNLGRLILTKIDANNYKVELFDLTAGGPAIATATFTDVDMNIVPGTEYNVTGVIVGYGSTTPVLLNRLQGLV